MGCSSSVGTADHSAHMRATAAKVTEVLERVREENAERLRQQALLKKTKEQQRREAELHIFNSINNTHHHNINSKNYHYTNENFIAALDRAAGRGGGLEASLNGLPQFQPNGKSFLLYGSHQSALGPLADEGGLYHGGEEGDSSFGSGRKSGCRFPPLASLHSEDVIVVNNKGERLATHFASASVGGSPTSQPDTRSKSMPKNDSRSHNHFSFLLANNLNCVQDESVASRPDIMPRQSSLGADLDHVFASRQVSGVDVVERLPKEDSPPHPEELPQHQVKDGSGTSMDSIAFKLSGISDLPQEAIKVEAPFIHAADPIHSTTGAADIAAVSNKLTSIVPGPVAPPIVHSHGGGPTAIGGGTHSPDCGSHTITMRQNTSTSDSNYTIETINLARLTHCATQVSETSNSINPTVLECRNVPPAAFGKATSSPTIRGPARAFGDQQPKVKSLHFSASEVRELLKGKSHN